MTFQLMLSEQIYIPFVCSVSRVSSKVGHGNNRTKERRNTGPNIGHYSHGKEGCFNYSDTQP
jgi:hypothetical protein